MSEIPSDEEGLYEYLWKEYSNEQPPDHIPTNRYNEYIITEKVDWEKRRERLIRRLDMQLVRKILESRISSDEDTMTQEEEIANEYDELPIDEEPEDDETE